MIVPVGGLSFQIIVDCHAPFEQWCAIRLKSERKMVCGNLEKGPWERGAFWLVNVKGYSVSCTWNMCQIVTPMHEPSKGARGRLEVVERCVHSTFVYLSLAFLSLFSLVGYLFGFRTRRIHKINLERSLHAAACVNCPREMKAWVHVVFCFCALRWDSVFACLLQLPFIMSLSYVFQGNFLTHPGLLQKALCKLSVVSLPLPLAVYFWPTTPINHVERTP